MTLFRSPSFSFMVLRNIRRRHRPQRRKMSTNTTTTTKEASADDIERVLGIEDDDRGGRGSGSMMGLMSWQQQRSVDFTCYRMANSNTVSSLSCRCLVLVLFSSDTFNFSSLQEILTVLQSCGKYFLPSVHYPCVCTPYVQESKTTTSSHDQ